MSQVEATLRPATAGRRPGRPRRPDIEERVLKAVRELLDSGEPVTVRAVVARSGASRAAVYRRWESLTHLLAAALDHGRGPVWIDPEVPTREAVLGGYFDALQAPDRHLEDRVRLRLRLGLADRELQHVIWQSHVARRRAPLAEALRRGIERGEIRADVDVEATIDAMNGLFYYQAVVRGAPLNDPATRVRCAAALDLIWRGIAA
ncbi:AcrR family transcriptional regulator [Nonomuraea thailandensis]|uniref:AcrR family transcriptional regulator n=1 Tax=Nonomuraea thailandensis TaxID=1188745 RepID=A0A9X2GG96_9ACTN|nr:TetR/AcrR family transcriptional regulator C-terminal ligand-binding domain-containing protein [Nonomuraea thailandensis]MCP2358341.1 AcrR family transcriptional regulator [Nonomuraea thailandensis]